MSHGLNGLLLFWKPVGSGNGQRQVGNAIYLEDEMDKTTLLRTIQTEYAHLEALIAPLSEAQLSTPSSEGQWSIKDVLAHNLLDASH